ncbi:MAG: hypothetical protein AABW67_06505 [Nanoarchaeota archaeon]
METKFIKLEYEESLDTKKNLLSSQLNLLRTSKNLRNYKILRTKEIAIKNKLNVALKTLKAKISLIQSTFPEKQKSNIPYKKERVVELNKQQSIQRQLEDIQGKLAKLQ